MPLRFLRKEPHQPPDRPPVPVVLYSRPGCHLCEVMKEQLAAAQLPEHTLTEVDIEGDPELEAEHGRSIPVLEIGGRKAFKGRLDPVDLPRKFERLAAAWYTEGAPQLMPKLFVLSGPEVGKSFVVRPGDTLGRSPDRIVTLRHASVSRKHAHLEEEEGVWYVVDDGSANGVVFEGERAERAGLFDAAEFSLGEIRLRFRVDQAAPAPDVAPEGPVEEEIFLDGEDAPQELEAPATKRPARRAASPLPKPKATDPGRKILQYGRVEGGAGVSGSDLAQYPLWVRALLVLIGLALAGGIAYLSFRGTFFVKEQVRGGAPVQAP